MKDEGKQVRSQKTGLSVPGSLNSTNVENERVKSGEQQQQHLFLEWECAVSTSIH